MENINNCISKLIDGNKNKIAPTTTPAKDNQRKKKPGASISMPNRKMANTHQYQKTITNSAMIIPFYPWLLLPIH